MNIRGLGWVGCLILVVGLRSVEAQNRLEPPTSILFRDSSAYDYCKNVDALFFAPTPRGYLARMFCRPGFNQPQWCVTIYRDPTTRSCTVESVEAQRTIDEKPESLKIAVTRAKQPIDAETAALVEAVWRRMLRQVRYPDEQNEGGDGDEFDFARNLVGFGRFDLLPGDPPYGSEQGQTYGPDAGTFPARLVEIGQNLKRFSLAATTEQRAALCTEIRTQARQLDADLIRPPITK